MPYILVADDPATLERSTTVNDDAFLNMFSKLSIIVLFHLDKSIDFSDEQPSNIPDILTINAAFQSLIFKSDKTEQPLNILLVFVKADVFQPEHRNSLKLVHPENIDSIVTTLETFKPYKSNEDICVQFLNISLNDVIFE